jgi:hypothetical protein
MPIERNNLSNDLKNSIPKVFTRVPTAAEVTATVMLFTLPKQPTAVDVFVYTTATMVRVAFDGGWSWAAGVLTVNNVGAVKWAVTSTVSVRAYGPFTNNIPYS